MLAKFANYMDGVKQEMHLVTWPTKVELRNMSASTIVTLVVAGTMIWAIDTILVLGITKLATI